MTSDFALTVAVHANPEAEIASVKSSATPQCLLGGQLAKIVSFFACSGAGVASEKFASILIELLGSVVSFFFWRHDDFFLRQGALHCIGTTSQIDNGTSGLVFFGIRIEWAFQGRAVIPPMVPVYQLGTFFQHDLLLHCVVGCLLRGV